MVRRMTITLVTVTAVAGIGLYALPGGHARAATPALASGPLNSLAASPGPVTSSSLNTLALAAASESGDSTPSSIQYVDTTHQLAEEATSGDGDPTDTNTPVALIVGDGSLHGVRRSSWSRQRPSHRLRTDLGGGPRNKRCHGLGCYEP